MNLIIILILSCFHFCWMKNLNNNNGCEINPFGERCPLLIYFGSQTFIYPHFGSKNITFSKDDTMEIACPSGKITINGNQLTSLVQITCKTGEIFQINGQNVDWNQIKCTNDIKPNIIEIKSNEDSSNIYCEGTNLKIIKIGFQLTTDRFLNHIDICFDTKTKLALYSYSNLVSSVNNRATKVDSPGFKQDDNIYKMSKSLKQIYRNNQTTINNIVNLDSDSEKYINKNAFINRGHLSAKADFVYAAQQTATYRYINAAPQWNTFNGGNWNTMENDLRNYVDKNQVNLQVWTGTYGISTLPNDYNEEFEKLYLYIDETDKKNSPAFPVPEVFWKLVYDPVNSKGIILVGHNNPYERTIEKICDKDLSASVSWLNWDRNNVTKGFSYACTCSDDRFFSLISVVPKFPGSYLLK